MILLETTNTVHRSVEREHLLAPSASGRRYVVLEVESRGEEVEAFEVSGWLRAEAAERRRLELEREERWLDEGSRERMRAGEILRLEELRWASPLTT